MQQVFCLRAFVNSLLFTRYLTLLFHMLPSGSKRLYHPTDQHTFQVWLWVPRKLWTARHHTFDWQVFEWSFVMWPDQLICHISFLFFFTKCKIKYIHKCFTSTIFHIILHNIIYCNYYILYLCRNFTCRVVMRLKRGLINNTSVNVQQYLASLVHLL